MDENLKLSIIVCTYNRDDVLEACLNSLFEQTAKPDTFEVIIVDNNSNDSTSDISNSYIQKYPNFRHVIETKQGLSHARNRGFEEAKGRYVGYIDDDAKAEKNWVETALKIIETEKPDIFGGPIDPFYEGNKPDWLKDIYNSYSKYSESGYIANVFLSGSNIFFDKQLLVDYGGFDPEFGMKGKHPGYHEETAFLMRAHKDHKKVYYSLDLLVYHLVPKRKQNILHHMYTSFKSGKDAVHLWKREVKGSDYFNLPVEIDQLWRNFYIALTSRDKEKYPYPENYVVEVMHALLSELGQKVEMLSYQKPSTTKLIKDILYKPQVGTRRLNILESLWLAIQVVLSTNEIQFFVDVFRSLLIKVKKYFHK